MIRGVLCLYFDAKAMFSLNNADGPQFDFLHGVRQGCPASPSFFTVDIRLVHTYLSCLEYTDNRILLTLTANDLQDMFSFNRQELTTFRAAFNFYLICF